MSLCWFSGCFSLKGFSFVPSIAYASSILEMINKYKLSLLLFTIGVRIEEVRKNVKNANKNTLSVKISAEKIALEPRSVVLQFSNVLVRIVFFAGSVIVAKRLLATLREMGDSAKIGLSPNGRWEIYPKFLPSAPPPLTIITL